MNNKYLSFSVNDKTYVFNILDVHSIIRKKPSEIKPIPDTPQYLMGITRLREVPIPIISCQILFGGELGVYSEYDIIVVRASEDLYGIVVDSVVNVKNIEFEEFQSIKAIQDVNQYVIGIYPEDDDLLLLIDIETLINFKNIGEIKNEY